MSNITHISYNIVKVPTLLNVFLIFLIRAKHTSLNFKLKNEGLISLKSDYLRVCVRWSEAKLLWKEQVN